VEIERRISRHLPLIITLVFVTGLLMVGLWGDDQGLRLATITLASISAIGALLALIAVAETRAEERHARTVQNLVRLGERLGDLGERVIVAQFSDKVNDWALARFTQREVRFALGTLGDEFGLKEAHAAVEFEVDNKNYGEVYDGTKAAMHEVEKATEAVRK